MNLNMRGGELMWISVKDKLPDMHDQGEGWGFSSSNKVLVTNGRLLHIGFVVKRPSGVEWYAGPDISVPSHWMPIPELPKQEEV